jgi:hypothetical protein
MSPWQKVLESCHGHFVQLYQTEESSIPANAGTYFWAGLRQGESVLAVTSPEQWNLFCRQLDRLGADVPGALRNRQLVFCDNRETLARFMAGGQPDWHRFEQAIRGAMRTVRLATANKSLRVYGDMVGCLWKTRQFSAAIRLEQLWNKLQAQLPFSLYCGYGLDAFGEGSCTGDLDSILQTHTHLIPAQPNGNLEGCLNSAMEEILGPRAGAARSAIGANRRPSSAIMPKAEAILVWLRKNLPGEAEQIVARARQHWLLAESQPN